MLCEGDTVPCLLVAPNVDVVPASMLVSVVRNSAVVEREGVDVVVPVNATEDAEVGMDDSVVAVVNGTAELIVDEEELG